MKNISWRHHYLPVFYLNGFTNENRRFKIYDVQKKRFIKAGKEFSPESYFFEKDSNIIKFNGINNDFLETEHYSFFDNKISKLLDIINKSSNSDRFGITENDMPILNHFVSLMYWRLPHRKDELKKIIQKNDLNSLGLSIIDVNGERNKVSEENFKKDSEFIKSYKFYNSLMDSIKGVNCRTPYTIIESYEKLPSICSDNPVIFENKKFPKIYEDDYLFPLSGNKLFIKCNKKTNFDPYLRTMVDTLLYKQAVRYVSCTNEKSLSVIDDFYEKNNLSLEELKSEIFKRVK